MEYQVPQFIEVEDKIFGPLSLKQFIFVAGGVGLCAALVLYLHFIGVLLAIPVAALSLALAFYKVNDRTFLEMTEAGFNYYTKGRLYLWRKEQKQQSAAPVAPIVPAPREKLGLTSGKLHDLAWSLDIQDQNNQPPA